MKKMMGDELFHSMSNCCDCEFFVDHANMVYPEYACVGNVLRNGAVNLCRRQCEIAEILPEGLVEVVETLSRQDEVMIR